MSLTKRLGLIVGAAMSLSSVAMAQSTLDSSRAYANELMSDSSGRASSLAGPAFTPSVHGYNQTRFTLNNRSDTAASINGAQPAGVSANTSKLTTGFTNARTALSVEGKVGTEDWGYKVEIITGDIAGGGVVLQDAYGTYAMGSGWGLQWGQFQSQYIKENAMSDTAQLAIDRSVTDGFFGGNRVQGVQVDYKADSFRFFGTLSDGLNTANTDYPSGVPGAVNAGETDIGLTGRGEFMWAGSWAQADQFTSWQNDPFFGMVGGAIHFQNGGSTVNTLKTQLFGLTADVMVKGNGWNAFAAIMYQHAGKNPGTIAGQAVLGNPATSLKTDDLGIVLQGGIFVAPQWELFGRIDLMKADKNYGSALDTSGNAFKLDGTFIALTAGANYYVVPSSQAVKLTAELEFFANRPNATAIAGGNTLNGLLASPDGKSGQLQVAAQAQIKF